MINGRIETVILRLHYQSHDTSIRILVNLNFHPSIRKFIESDPRWYTCSHIYNALEKFIDKGLWELVEVTKYMLVSQEFDALSDDEYDARTEQIEEDYDAFSDLVRKSTLFTGVWKILGYLRGAWGDMTLDVNWVQRHECLGYLEHDTCIEWYCGEFPEYIEEWLYNWGRARWGGYNLLEEWMEEIGSGKIYFGVDLPCESDYEYFEENRQRLEERDEQRVRGE